METPHDRLQRLRLDGVVTFTATVLQDALDFLAAESRRLDDGQPVEGRGVPIFLGLNENDPLRAWPITLRFDGESLLDALCQVAQAVAVDDGILRLIFNARGVCLHRFAPATVATAPEPTTPGHRGASPTPPPPTTWGEPPTFADPAERHVVAAEGFSELGMPEQVLAELAGVEPADPPRAGAVARLRACALCSLSRWAELAGLCQAMIAQDGQNSFWPRMTGFALLRQGHASQAKELLEPAAACFPEDSGVVYCLAWTLTRLGDVEAARPHLYRAMNLAPLHRRMAVSEPDLKAFWPELTQAQ